MGNIALPNNTVIEASGRNIDQDVQLLAAAVNSVAGMIRRYSSDGIVVGYTNVLDALAALSAGNGLELGVGVFPLGTTNMVLPARVSIVGSGMAGELCYGDTTLMGGTVITWAGSNAANGAAGVPGDYNHIRNLSIAGVPGTGQCPFGSLYAGANTQQGSVGVVVDNVYLFGTIDAVLANQSTGLQNVQWDFRNCIFESGFDTFNTNSTTVTLRQFNCITNIDATKNPTPTVCRAISAAGSTIEVFGGRAAILSAGPTRNSVAETVNANAVIRMFNVGMYVPAAATLAAHFNRGTPSTLAHTGCYTLDGAPFLVTGVPTQIGNSTIMTTALDPKNATAGSRPVASAAGVLCFYSGKLYICTNAATPTWEQVTSA